MSVRLSGTWTSEYTRFVDLHVEVTRMASLVHVERVIFRVLMHAFPRVPLRMLVARYNSLSQVQS